MMATVGHVSKGYYRDEWLPSEFSFFAPHIAATTYAFLIILVVGNKFTSTSSSPSFHFIHKNNTVILSPSSSNRFFRILKVPPVWYLRHLFNNGPQQVSFIGPYDFRYQNSSTVPHRPPNIPNSGRSNNATGNFGDIRDTTIFRLLLRYVRIEPLSTPLHD
jgi:hypothetical protein